MRRPWWLLIVLAGTLAAVAASDGDDLERNRLLLARWRLDPEHYLRLRRDLRAFHALPRDRQERLRQFDRQLHAADLTTQTRLWSVLDRYAGWLEKLPPADRARVLEAPNAASKLAAIRDIRDREWVDALPAKLRDEVRALPGDVYAARVAELRDEERRHRNLWQKGMRSKDGPILRPSKTSDFTPEVVAFIKEMSRRMSAADRERLKQAEGKWPDLPRLVRDLADDYPALPPLPTGPIKEWMDLPKQVKQSLNSVAQRKKLKQLDKHSGNWPEYAWEATKLLPREKRPGPPLGASKPADFPPETRAFLETRLFPNLKPHQKDTLTRLEDRWPEYPLAVVRMARDLQLLVPGLNLPPGPPEVWENVRLALPEVPDRLLIQFARDEASAEDRARWELDTADPMGSRQKVKEAWYRKRLAEQARKRAKDTYLNGAQ